MTTDELVQFLNAAEQGVKDIREENESLHEQIGKAIDILDGNAKPIQWRDKSQPELLRKLCEHIETVDKHENMEDIMEENAELRRQLEAAIIGDKRCATCRHFGPRFGLSDCGQCAKVRGMKRTADICELFEAIPPPTTVLCNTPPETLTSAGPTRYVRPCGIDWKKAKERTIDIGKNLGCHTVMVPALCDAIIEQVEGKQ